MPVNANPIKNNNNNNIPLAMGGRFPIPNYGNMNSINNQQKIIKPVKKIKIKFKNIFKNRH